MSDHTTEGPASLERWVALPGYEGLYEVSDHGRLRSVDRHVPRRTRGGRFRKCFKRGRLIAGGSHKGGYTLIHLYRDGQREVTTLHACIALAFIGPRPEGMLVCHIDGDSSNNRPENLMYGSPQDNMDHRIGHGTKLYGERMPVSKLTEKDVAEIRAAPSCVNQHDLARRYGVTNSNISAIRRGKSWRHSLQCLPATTTAEGETV